MGSWSVKEAVQAKVRARLNDPSAERILLALYRRILLEKMKVCAPELYVNLSFKIRDNCRTRRTRRSGYTFSVYYRLARGSAGYSCWWDAPRTGSSRKNKETISKEEDKTGGGISNLPAGLPSMIASITVCLYIQNLNILLHFYITLTLWSISIMEEFIL